MSLNYRVIQDIIALSLFKPEYI